MTVFHVRWIQELDRKYYNKSYFPEISIKNGKIRFIFHKNK
jgi:hypothetical protein